MPDSTYDPDQDAHVVAGARLPFIKRHIARAEGHIGLIGADDILGTGLLDRGGEVLIGDPARGADRGGFGRLRHLGQQALRPVGRLLLGPRVRRKNRAQSGRYAWVASPSLTRHSLPPPAQLRAG